MLLGFSLPRYCNQLSSFNSKHLAILCSSAGRFMSDLVGNPQKKMFSVARVIFPFSVIDVTLDCIGS